MKHPSKVTNVPGRDTQVRTREYTLKPVHPNHATAETTGYLRQVVTNPMLQIVTRELGCQIVSIDKKHK